MRDDRKRQACAQALAKVLAYQECNKPGQAEQWARELVLRLGYDVTRLAGAALDDSGAELTH